MKSLGRDQVHFGFVCPESSILRQVIDRVSLPWMADSMMILDEWPSVGAPDCDQVHHWICDDPHAIPEHISQRQRPTLVFLSKGSALGPCPGLTAPPLSPFISKANSYRELRQILKNQLQFWMGNTKLPQRDQCCRSSLMVVEDEESQVFLIQQALDDIEFIGELHTFKNGVVALDHLRCSVQKGEALPSLILLDLMLPGMSGKEVIKDIKTTSALGGIPVCVLSSSNRVEDPRYIHSFNPMLYIDLPPVMELAIQSVESALSAFKYSTLLTSPS